MRCEACITRARKGLDGLCPSCAAERTHRDLENERAGYPCELTHEQMALSQHVVERADRVAAELRERLGVPSPNAQARGLVIAILEAAGGFKKS